MANTIEEMFKKKFNGERNLMTPDIIEYGRIKESLLIYEISEGDFLGKDIYGLTILEMKGNELERRYDLSQSFDNMNELEYYIKMLEDNSKGEKL